jgi:hypothetical protein
VRVHQLPRVRWRDEADVPVGSLGAIVDREHHGKNDIDTQRIPVVIRRCQEHKGGQEINV